MTPRLMLGRLFRCKRARSCAWVATTSLIADVVANVWAVIASNWPNLSPQALTRTALRLPHDVRTLNDAHVIFINGLG